MSMDFSLFIIPANWANHKQEIDFVLMPKAKPRKKIKNE